MKYIKQTYLAAVPAQSQARLNSIKMGQPYGTVITTTPNSQDSPSGEFAYMIRNGSLAFRLEFYDYGPKKVRELIETQAEFNFLYGEYSYKELGRSEEWFQVQCRELLNDRAQIKREILLDWPLSTEGSVFEEEQLDKLKMYKKEVIATLPIILKDELGINLEFMFVEMPDPDVPYILTIDTSGGVGRDYSAFVLTNPANMHAIAVLKTNTADDEVLKKVSEYIMVNLFPKSIAVIERNYLGLVVINYLLKSKNNLEPRMFYLEKEKEAERIIGKSKIKYKKRVRVYGIDTTPDSRDAMFRHLFQIIDDHPQYLQLGNLQDEIRTLQRKKTGKIEHRAGFHDDVLMSYLLGIYADRHEQPVLRGILSRMTTTKVKESMDVISSLNTSIRQTISSHQMKNKMDTLVMDDYIKEESIKSKDEMAKNRQKLMNMISDLNS
jgi:hypothetical protein